MSDFFTKKQKKFWCDYCKKFIEYSHQMIEQHNRSKIHKMNAERETKHKNRVAKNQKFKERSHDNNNFLNRKIERNDHILANKESYNESNDYLEEIKREKMTEKLYLEGKLKDPNQKIWGMFFDNGTQLPFYYNFITKVSQWERPADYDGPELDFVQGNNENNEPKEEKAKNVAQPGKWEEVEPSSYFFKKAENEEDIEKQYLPGLNDDDYYEDEEYLSDLNDNQKENKTIKEKDKTDQPVSIEIQPIKSEKKNLSNNTYLYFSDS